MARTFTVLGMTVFGAMAFFLLRKAEAGYERISGFRGRSAFSTNSFFDPSIAPGKAIDGDPATQWAEAPPGGALCRASTASAAGEAIPSPVIRPLCLFLQMDLGFTHSPAHPPRPAPLRSLRIDSPGGDFARPRRVRLVFFSQEIVDMDREFRLPPLPEFLTQKEVLLPDSPVQEVGLDFLPAPLPSSRYPAGVRRIQVRIEILDVYPGRSNTVAISEVSFTNRAE